MARRHRPAHRPARVTVYARNVGKVPPTWPEDLRLIVSEITDADAIDDTATGADAVIPARGAMDRKATGLPLALG